MKKIAFIAGMLLLTVSCNTVKKVYTIHPKSKTTTEGQVTFVQKGDFVEMKIKAANLSPGLHAVHIHEKGDCSSDDGMSAGGHWNPTSHNHGQWGVGEFHMGDIGNINANAEGVGTLTFKTDKWCIGCDDSAKNIVGKGLIIHDKVDDFHTQPTGNAGGRVGCVEIK